MGYKDLAWPLKFQEGFSKTCRVFLCSPAKKIRPNCSRFHTSVGGSRRSSITGAVEVAVAVAVAVAVTGAVAAVVEVVVVVVLMVYLD